MIDAHEIAPGLWMGGAPPEGSALAGAGFRFLCLCAWEHQPRVQAFPGVEVCRIDLDDDGQMPPAWQLDEAWHLGALVARRVRRGRPALVTCWQGRNRSGLVVAMALCHLTGCAGPAAVQAVRERRRAPAGATLTNQVFVRALSAIAPRRRGQQTFRAALAAGLG